MQGGGVGGGGIGVGGVAGVGGALGAVAGSGNDPAAITADLEGVVNKLCFRRVMWSKWVVDTECLLDGEGGFPVGIAFFDGACVEGRGSCSPGVGRVDLRTPVLWTDPWTTVETDGFHDMFF